MVKMLIEMDARELREALDAAINEEKLAEFQDGLRPWMEMKLAARSRQDAVVAELVRRRGPIEVLDAPPETLSGFAGNG